MKWEIKPQPRTQVHDMQAGYKQGKSDTCDQGEQIPHEIDETNIKLHYAAYSLTNVIESQKLSIWSGWQYILYTIKASQQESTKHAKVN